MTEKISQKKCRKQARNRLLSARIIQSVNFKHPMSGVDRIRDVNIRVYHMFKWQDRLEKIPIYSTNLVFTFQPITYCTLFYSEPTKSSNPRTLILV